MLSNHNTISPISRDSGLKALAKSCQMELSDNTSSPIITYKKKASIKRSFRSFLVKSFRSKTSSMKKTINENNYSPTNSNINTNLYQHHRINSIISTGTNKKISNNNLIDISTQKHPLVYSSDGTNSTTHPVAPVSSIFSNWKYVTAVKTLNNSSMRCLPFTEGQNFILLEHEDHDWMVVKDTKSNELGRVPSQYFIPSYKYHEYSVWFHPNISRVNSEHLLQNETTPGIFIVRNSESCSEQYSLSILFRFRDVKHYIIKVINDSNRVQGFFIHQSKIFLNMVELINYYSKYHDGLCCKLAPLVTQSFIDSKSSSINGKLDYFSKDNHSANVYTVTRSIASPIINCNELVLQKKIGSGNFGEVWLALAKQNQRSFAVKVLHHATKRSIQQFKNEILILSKLDHPKIVKYYTSIVDSKNDRYWIVTNLMEGGNLGEYLRHETNRAKVGFYELMYIVTQICTGMLYLEDNCIIHRDLAARNILVGETWQSIRICDFGMACDATTINTLESIIKNSSSCAITDIHSNLKENENINVTSNNNLQGDNSDHSIFALKWMAPEAALYREFSLKSDVWSFGILLFEIVTYGQQPYYSMTNKETVERVSNGYRLPQPTCCPNSIYNVMLSCWSQNPLLRPNFECLLNYFNKVSLILKYYYTY